MKSVLKLWVTTYDEFWLKYITEKKYPTLKLLLGSKFVYKLGFTYYVCELIFSIMNYIKKNSDLGSLTNILKYQEFQVGTWEQELFFFFLKDSL